MAKNHRKLFFVVLLFCSPLLRAQEIDDYIDKLRYLYIYRIFENEVVLIYKYEKVEKEHPKLGSSKKVELHHKNNKYLVRYNFEGGLNGGSYLKYIKSYKLSYKVGLSLNLDELLMGLQERLVLRERQTAK